MTWFLITSPLFLFYPWLLWSSVHRHNPVLDNFCEQLSHCLQHCATSTLSSIHHRASVPGWNIITHLFREKAKFWYSVWKQPGSPSGILQHIKRNAKSRYKHEVRNLKHHKQFIRHEKMAAAPNSKSFWQQVDHTRNPSPYPLSMGVSGSSHMSQLFSSKL